MGELQKTFDIYDGDTRLDAVLHFPTNYKEGEKIPLCIIMHGFTGNKEERHLLAVSDMMNEVCIATLRFDFFGHGLSDGEFKYHTLDIWVSNVLVVFAYAKTMNLFSKYILCGHSQGGLTAILAGAKLQDEIEGIIPMSPADVIVWGAREGVILGNRFDADHVPEEFVAKEGWILDKSYIECARNTDLESAIAANKKPVIIVTGTADATVDAELVKKDAKGFADCTLELIEGDSHCFDYHLEDAVEAIRKNITARGWA
ncbi:MAG: alpha/beta hydrolase [Lachnospiraceae bacterium]|nr:alpha/beta hydrolase [Lachnospiraceae bacterium]